MTGPFDTIRNAHGERLDTAFTPAGRSSAFPPEAAVVIAHGVTSNKDRPYLIALADGLARAGVAALRISYTGNGASEGAFEDATPTKEAADLGAVLDALRSAGVRRIGYAGHSMGGAVGVLRAAEDDRIGCLVSLAGMVHVHAFMQRCFGHLAYGEPMSGRPECPWSRTLEEDARRLGSVLPQAARIGIPWLLVHGDADDLVPLQDSLDARAAAGGRPELVTLPGVDHRFTGAIDAMVEAVVPWIVRHL
ncbi:MAG TPA: alpha/beta fold hydrolase [Vicinamibacterales bacterium]